jgi:hypothetical protein
MGFKLGDVVQDRQSGHQYRITAVHSTPDLYDVAVVSDPDHLDGPGSLVGFELAYAYMPGHRFEPVVENG